MCLKENESVSGPFKGTSGFSGSFFLTQMARVPTGFYSPDFVRASLLRTGTLDWGDAWVRLGLSFL